MTYYSGVLRRIIVNNKIARMTTACVDAGCARSDAMLSTATFPTALSVPLHVPELRR